LQQIVGRKKSSAGKAKKKECKDVKKDRSTAKPKAQSKKRKASGDDSDEKASAKKKKVSSASKSLQLKVELQEGVIGFLVKLYPTKH